MKKTSFYGLLFLFLVIFVFGSGLLAQSDSLGIGAYFSFILLLYAILFTAFLYFCHHFQNKIVQRILIAIIGVLSLYPALAYGTSYEEKSLDISTQAFSLSNANLIFRDDVPFLAVKSNIIAYFTDEPVAEDIKYIFPCKKIVLLQQNSALQQSELHFAYLNAHRVYPLLFHYVTGNYAFLDKGKPLLPSYALYLTDSDFQTISQQLQENHISL